MLKIKLSLALGLLGAGLVNSSSTLAIEQDAETETVVVTATRTAQTVNQSTSSVQIIDQSDIERMQARSVPDLLRGLAGVQITRNGGRGKNTSLFIRGTNSDHVLVLIDGVKVGSATSGTTPFQDLPIEQIERIEIVRGPRSSLYGSEAIGGVIQIFTKQSEQSLAGSASMTIGVDATRELSGTVSGQNDGRYYSLGVSAVKTKGFDSCAPEAAMGGGCWTDEPDDDAYESVAAHLNAGLRFDNGSQLGFVGKQSRNKSEFDGGFQNESETEQNILGVNASLALTERWWLKFSAARSKDYSDNFKDGVYSSTFNTERDTVALQNDFMLTETGDQMFTLGGDYQRDEVSAADEYDKSERENFGLFTQYLVNHGAHDIELSARYDDNQQTGNSKTGGVGYAYRISEALRVVANYGTAFKAPSFNELYFPGFGNAALTPEESRTVEFGLRVQESGRQLDITLFHTKVDDLIAYDASIFAPNNIEEAEISGLELSLQQAFAKYWLLGLNVTAQSPRNISDGANDNNLLPRRAQRNARVDLDYARDDWSTGATLYMASSSYDDLANTNRLEAYQILDLRAGLDLNEDWRLQSRIENVFDSHYQNARHYNQPGRSVYLTLRYAP